MGITKTAIGIFAGSVAVDAFKAASQTDDLKDNLIFKGVGSLAASISLHTLKGEVIDVVKEMQQLGTGQRPKALPMKD